MLKMNYWGQKWDLHMDVCPCDAYFNEWVEAKKLTGKTFYHFGTGTHHIIGLRQAELGNTVFAITASKEEYDSYVALVTENALVAKSYLAYFGDIYLSNPRLLPDFDAVTMFHLYEFSIPTLERGPAAPPTRPADLMTISCVRAGTCCSTPSRTAGWRRRPSSRPGKGAPVEPSGFQDAAGLSQERMSGLPASSGSVPAGLPAASGCLRPAPRLAGQLFAAALERSPRS
jgi:hypothetical protein